MIKYYIFSHLPVFYTFQFTFFHKICKNPARNGTALFFPSKAAENIWNDGDVAVNLNDSLSASSSDKQKDWVDLYPKT